MTTTDRIKNLQRHFGLTPDGLIGHATLSAIERAAHVPVRASSFADPADIKAFKKCKAGGGSDTECFKVGDNGIGAWGHDTTGIEPMVALPREEWKSAGKKGGAKVRVKLGDKVVEAILGDTMPAYASINNGCGIDMNPSLCTRLGLRPPVLVEGVTWEWV